MATTPDHQSGGKMVRHRQTCRDGTPYDRSTSSPRGPNWFSRFVSSPSRVIATSGKLLSSVFASDSSSSSSSSDSLPNSDYEEDNGCETVHDGSSLGPDLPEKVLSQKSHTKQLIAQLISHESFSREECEWLTNIIKSRVVSALPVGSVEAGRLDEMLSGRDGNDMNSHTLLEAAVMEARKWLEEKNDSNSKSNLQHGTWAVNFAILTNGDGGDSTSPVDIAKSYMQARPPWSSPSINHGEFRSPSARLYSTTGSSLNLAKYKKASSASGSWNILEEIRKVRSKATEELLRNPASLRICSPSVVLDYKYSADCLTADKSAAREDNMVSSAKPVDAPTGGSQNMLDLQNDALQNVGPPSPGQKQIEEATRINEDTEGRSSPSGLGQKFLPTEDNKIAALSDVSATTNNNLRNCIGGNQHLSSTAEVHDSGVCHVNSLVEEEVGGPVTSIGFPSFCSLSAGGEVNHIPLELEKKRSESEEACPNSEATTDALKVCDNDTGGLQDTSVGHHESENLDDANRKRKSDDKSVGVEKQAGGKMSKYNRRGRGKGR